MLDVLAVVSFRNILLKSKNAKNVRNIGVGEKVISGFLIWNKIFSI